MYGMNLGYLLWFENCVVPENQDEFSHVAEVSGLPRVNHFFSFRWITPVLLLIDFYEKTAISSKRRAQMTKVHKTVYVFIYRVYGEPNS